MDLRSKENLVKKGPANLLRGVENVGGVLRVTSHRLIFDPHSVNLQTQQLAISLTEILSVEGARTLILGLIPAFSNAIVVRAHNGDEHRFTVFGRNAWIELIKGSIGRP